ATKALQDEIARREGAGAQPFTKQMATAFLQGLGVGLKRDTARTLIERGRGAYWQFDVLAAKGAPLMLRGINYSPPPHKSAEAQSTVGEGLQEGLFPRSAPDVDRENRTSQKASARWGSGESGSRGGRDHPLRDRSESRSHPDISRVAPPDSP